MSTFDDLESIVLQSVDAKTPRSFKSLTCTTWAPAKVVSCRQSKKRAGIYLCDLKSGGTSVSSLLKPRIVIDAIRGIS
jgi:hypothetical protein